MTIWSYRLRIPDDASAHELNVFRELAVATWRTAAESSGGRPGEATAVIVPNDDTDAVYRGGRELFSSTRSWHVEGEVT
jgi:hypothetical protein